MTRQLAPEPSELRAVLAETGSVKATAERYGVSRRTLHRWLKRLEIVVERRTLAA